MSGHSKWATIKHQKAVADKRRGRTFSKLAKAISVAARGGPNQEENFKLRLAVEKAKEVNMPKSNIERAIARGSGQTGESKLEAVTYEAYGPEKIALILEVVTDNRNRTTSEIKNLLEKNGGAMGQPGSVAYLFENNGLIVISKPLKAEEAILKIIDLGVENVEETNGTIEIITRPEKLESVVEQLRKMNLTIESKALVKSPKTLVPVAKPERKERLLKFMEMIEDHEDVQEIFANFNLVD